MTMRRNSRLNRNTLCLALAASLLLPAGAALAQDAPQNPKDSKVSKDSKDWFADPANAARNVHAGHHHYC
jgi:outer membrane biogenesis lipoprotein LolB